MRREKLAFVQQPGQHTFEAIARRHSQQSTCVRWIGRQERRIRGQAGLVGEKPIEPRAKMRELLEKVRVQCFRREERDDADHRTNSQVHR